IFRNNAFVQPRWPEISSTAVAKQIQQYCVQYTSFTDWLRNVESIECSSYRLLSSAIIVFINWKRESRGLQLTPRVTVLKVSPLCFGGAMTGVVVSLCIDDRYEHKERYLTPPAIICFVCLWMFIIYAVLVIGRYCRYLKALRLIRSRNRFNVDVSFFVTFV
ncbi:hypothetical protein COOONC_24590, partial [Cooperia oncophora]